MKQKLAIYAGLVAIGLVSAGPAMAQLVPYPAAGLPPYEVVALVRSTGFEPVSRPVRHGPVYTLNAVNKAGREVRVFVDARLARVVRIVPVAPKTNVAAADVPALPPPYTRPPAEIAAVPDGYGPASRAGTLQPEADEPAPYGPMAGHGALPVAPGRAPVANASPPTTHVGPPPLPRPRPKLAAVEPAPAPAAPAPTQAAPASAPPPAAASGTVESVSNPAAPATPPAAAAPEPVYELHE